LKQATFKIVYICFFVTAGHFAIRSLQDNIKKYCTIFEKYIFAICLLFPLRFHQFNIEFVV